jgi:2-polyprenyl-3-methyl-5-hydroxy-6-metoxy-1,4-benzoquinol methylase
MEDTPDVETSSESYALRFSGAVGAWFLEVQAATTRDLLSPWQGGTVLDVGGGHGQLTEPLLAAGHTITVSGSALVCCERIRSRVKGHAARFVVGPLIEGPWRERAFDTVVSFRLLPHVARWRELVATLCGAARHAVVVDYPTSSSINAVSGALFSLKKRVEGNTRPFLVFEDEEVAAAFEASGFRVTARRPQFLFPMALHRALGSVRVSRAAEAVARATGLQGLLGSPVILRAERVD